jgi:GTP-binding protein
LDGRAFLAIDTPGFRRHKSIGTDVEFYSTHRAQRSIRRADVVLLFIDAAVPLGQVDKKLAGYIIEEFKPVILVVNKWDLVAGKATQDDYRQYIDKMLTHLPFAPISFVTATEGMNVKSTVRLAQQLFEQAGTRVTTGVLNRAVEEVLALRGPSHKHGTKPPKVLYSTQVSTCPPTLVLFVNGLESFTDTYRRFLLNELRERLPYTEVPIRLILRTRREKAGREEDRKSSSAD